VDINGNLNIAGTVANMTQRVMAFGQDWHIIASKNAFDDIGTLDKKCQNLFHRIGFGQAKHKVVIEVYNVFRSEQAPFGNPTTPAGIEEIGKGAPTQAKPPSAQVTKPQEFLPKGSSVRPQARSTDFYRKLAEHNPRLGIQEAWAYMESVVNYALITQGLNPSPEMSEGNLHTKMSQLIGHGDVKLNDGQRILGDFYQKWATATSDPEFKPSNDAVLVTIIGLLEFSSQLVEKCDRVLAIRNAARHESEHE